MLEGLVASLLNRFLGMYIRNFDPKQLNVGIWSGDVKLRDLELRREALDQLKLPINVVEGHLGQLTLKIPWSNLRGQPVQVYIEDVFVLAAPKEDAEWDEEEEERRRQAVKIEKLDSAEMLKERNSEGLSQEEQQKSQSFTDSLVTKIVDNLQITVKNIHVRYEDSISAPGHPFALGLTLKEFSAISTDGNWKPTYIQNSVGTTHKLATLGALALYWNTDTKLLGTGREAEVADAEVTPHDEMLEKFRDMIIRGENPEGAAHQYILKPVSGQAKIEMDKSGKSTVPHVKAGLIFDEIGLVLDDDQYRDALMMVDLFHYFIRHQEYKKLQPKGVSPKEDPRAWLQFAGNAVLSKIHDRNRRWSWDFFKERRDDRIRYIELFKKKKKQTEQLTPDEVTELNKLEWKSSYEDMRFWRSLARNQLRKENVGVKKTDSAKKNQGWVAWAWGSKPQEQEEDSETTMTEEQRKELYDAIDWDEKTALAESVDLPKETVKMQLNASLNTGSFTLKQNPHDDVVEILSLYFDGFRAKFLQRPDSFLADVSLAGLRVNDGTTPESLFPQIVRVKDAPDTPIPKITLDDESDPADLVDPFFNFQLEKNPLDGQGDIAVTGKLKPLEIIWNPHFLVGVIQFFKPPERHMESIGALMETAGATVESLRQQTRAGLEFALEEHKTINAKLDLQAPLIIVPESITTKNTICLILDAGHISVNSQLVDRDTMDEVQSKQKQMYTDDDYKRLESLMYDKFQVKLSSTQVLIGPSIEATKAQLEDRDDKQSMHIVEQINVDFMVELSIIPKAPNLAKVRISGHLPLLHVSASDKKYKSLMRIIEVAIPNLDEEEEKPGTVAPKTPEASRQRSQSNLSKKQSMSKENRKSASFQFTTQEAVILQDESDDETEFQDASHGDDASEKLKLQQRNFELKFEVDRLQGSLYRSDPDGRKPDQLLVELVADKFSLNLCVRPYDLIVETSLESLMVDDYVEEHPTAEFKSIVSSGDADSQENKDLIHVKLVRVKKESPEFMPKYEGVETNLNCAISTINLVVTRKTLLTLLDFILITFTNNDAPTTAASPDEIMDSDNKELVPAAAPKPADSGSVRIKIDLKSIRLILNNDGIRLATLSLNAADVGIFVLGKTLRIRAKLGDLSLLDDINQGASPDSSLRQLITIQGDDLADFRYETFDAENTESYPGYDSSIFLRAGSIKLNFLEEPFRKIIDFLVKFGKMQAIFNAARQAAANQASQIQQSTSRFKFDINVKTPIVVFPRAVVPDRPHRDLITAYLGEIYAENKFVPLDDSKDSIIAMKLSAGIRNIRLTSDFYFHEDKSEELELIDKVDLGFQVTYAEHSPGIKRPDMEIEGHMTDFNLRISQMQLKFLLELARSVPAAFAVDSDEDEQQAIEDVPAQTSKKAKTIQPKEPENSDHSSALVDLGPELGVDSKNWTKLDLAFHVHTIGLELLLAKEDEPIGDIEAASLSKFSLDDTKVKLRMMTDGSLESELLIDSFTIQDSRSRTTNKFRKIMTSSNKDVQQFMASVTISGGKERNLIAIIAVDSPRVIFALDYIFALQSFVAGGLAVDEPVVPEDDESIADSADDSDTDMLQLSKMSRPISARSKSQTPTSSQSSQSSDPPMNIAFRVNIVDAQVILIANPLSASSEAIVLGTKQVLLAQQHALTLQVSQMGMFLCRMDRFEDTRLRILDDFSLQMSMDSSKADLTSMHLDVEPLVLRLSLRDILLALQIVSRASELSKDDDKEDGKALASDVKAKQLKGSSGTSLKRRSASGKATSTMAKKTKSGSVAPSRLRNETSAGKAVQKHEEMTATLEGMRVILIGDLHELPILDLSIKNFTASANDWSSSLRADTSIDMYINIYNFAKSSWEPLIEPWSLGLQVAKDQDPDSMFIDLTSQKMLELTVTSATIALASKSFQFLTQEEDVLSKPRGAEAPYRIRNYTGFDVNVWADVPGEENDMAVKLEDGEEGPWRFEDWEKMRENLSPESNTGVIGVRLEGSGFDSINKIGVNREGEYLYSLRPRKDQILHRLLVEITLGTDNVKYITLRSPLLVENKTQIPVELGVFDAQEGHLLKIEKIAPGESRPAPVGAAFMKSLLVRPDQGFGYSWSTESLWWKDLLQRPTRTMVCKAEQDKNTPPFYFQMHATFDKSNPLTNIYPYMRIRLSAPVELENLLPYDFKYRIYDKNTKKDWTNFLRKGGLSPVHVVELSHLLLLSIDMQDTVFKASEFAIINSNNQEDFRKESILVCKDNEGLALNLRLHYYKIPDSGGAFRVTVYSPYVILNKTGLGINIRAKSLLQQAKTAAGQGFHTDSADTERRKALPYMFAFGADDQRNRALLKVGESAWSRPQSFDAIGSTVDVVLPSSTKNTEIHIGITVAAGDGKYKMTKVVTLAPRFVIKNQMKEELNVREPGSSQLMTLQPGALQPLHFLQKSAVKQLSLCFPGLNNQWSSPFTISDLGVAHIKLAKAGQRQQLIRVEILMENATIFLHLIPETKNWPFSMRNESDTEFMFFQANPNLDDEDAEDRSGWRPIRYRLPPRSIMPYAWDYPAAKHKELILNANGKERHVKLAEIGNLIPMKIPPPRDAPGAREPKIIDLNVAADGPTQTLILSNYKASKSLYKQKTRTDSTTSLSGGFEVKSQDTGVTFRAQLKLAGFGISLVNAHLKELAYVTFRDISLKYSESPLFQTFIAGVKWVQIDNQLYGGIFPMILYPSVVPKNQKETESHPCVHVMVTRVKDDSYGVLYIKYATLLLQQMTLEIDEDFVFALLDFSKVPGASWAETHEGVLCDENLDIPEPSQDQSGQDIYFELLNIQPMQLDLSFVRTDRVNVEDKTSSRNPLMFFLNVLTMAIGNINDAPVRLNALMLENARVSAGILIQNITNHYSQEALYQVHKVLGSADFLGNPVGLFNNMSSGVADLFYEPYQGFIMADRPEQLGIGIAKGATSFVKKSVFGVSDSFSKFTGSIAKGLAEATMDKQFQDRRRMTRSRNRPKHALYGVTAGTNSLVSSVASGIGGLARKPLEGAEQEGVAGFFKGVGKGALGFVTKPAIGVFDLASNVSEGIRNTTTVFDGDGLERVRLTRFIGTDGIVRPYSQREALGQFWLKQLDNGKYFNESYIAHLELPREDVVVMLTYSRIMLIKSKKLTSEWDVPLKDIQTISKERTGLSLTLRGGTNGPFIPVAEESSRNFLYKKIGVAVNEFNKKYKATE
ncbi:putative vacuolar protein sorting-associated protein 13 [Mollisia scopiformis]|uniref:Vacuolar protein sorting-associated protein n=1 Tax=Mollisia scopiformis TaxID=149040 RepID=A0A194X511_MOLSC|nr:putative vacuolar protein sorting-associated protein 13 [Mollisia scopiformis]KUJ15268.1 putative vacuolar protein sorting-associated protein 13 [Mollisia scopiformis]